MVDSLGPGLIPELSPPFHSGVQDGDVDASAGLMWREKDLGEGEKASQWAGREPKCKFWQYPGVGRGGCEGEGVYESRMLL